MIAEWRACEAMTILKDGVYHCSVCGKAVPSVKPPPGMIFVELFCSLPCKSFAEEVKVKSKEIVKAVFNYEVKDVQESH